MRLARTGRHFFLTQPLGAAGLVMIAIMLFASVFAEWVAPYDPVAIDFAAMLAAPSGTHWLGTDQFGRDILSRIIYGARTALSIGFFSSFIGCTLGAAIGVASALFRRQDRSPDPAADRRPAVLPDHRACGRRRRGAGLALGGRRRPQPGVRHRLADPAQGVARVIRSAALSVREMLYVDAARACGYSNTRIMFVHIAPNVIAPYLIILTAYIAQAILLEASLSFLGLGVTEPTPAWGLMLSGSSSDFYREAPWMIIFPGLAISLSVFAFNLFGDSLRDWLDPKFKT